MALVVQSRFAGLKVEDDDCTPAIDNQKPKTNIAKKTEPLKKNKTSNNKTQPGGKKKKSKSTPVSADQWELWKQKDEELVDGNFESELQQAILLSKLDFEEKKDVYKLSKKEAQTNKKIENNASRSSTKKQNKKNIMSLDQFNEMVTNSGEENKLNHIEAKEPSEHSKTPDRDTEFFERVKDDARNELIKDKMNDVVRDRQTVSDEALTRVQLVDALEKKDEEIAVLRQELGKLQRELLLVRSRNKKLCGILAQGEMKDKGAILMEVERLRAVQSELTAELAILHTDLEKERSKNTDPRTKDKRYSTRKKNIRFDVSSEALLQKDSSTTSKD